MFIELPKAMQWKELNDRVNWTGLTTTEKDDVMARALEDMMRKNSGEIYPATWFDGVLLTVDPSVKVYDLGELKRRSTHRTDVITWTREYATRRESKIVRVIADNWHTAGDRRTSTRSRLSHFTPHRLML